MKEPLRLRNTKLSEEAATSADLLEERLEWLFNDNASTITIDSTSTSRRNSDGSFDYCLDQLFCVDEEDSELTDFCLNRLFDEEYEDFVSIYSPSLLSNEIRALAESTNRVSYLEDESGVENFYRLIVCCICDVDGAELKRQRISWKHRSCCVSETEEFLARSYDGNISVICASCLRNHVTAKIEEGIPFIMCPGSVDCDRTLCDGELAELLSEQLFERLQRLREGLRRDPLKKTCPNCAKINEVSDRNALNITCPACDCAWCFQCHAPWHNNLTCHQYLKGDRSLKIWARNKGHLIRNAVKCPKCKVFIQRNGGCDHMTCSRCNTDFCYSCGERYVKIWGSYFGNHHSKFSVFGCKNLYKPNRPTHRVAVRGSLFTGKLLLLPFAAALLLGAGSVVLAGLVVASPVLVPYIIFKRNTEVYID